MAFKDIHKLKKVVEIQKENIQVEHLVIGKDIFAISTFKFLVEKYGMEKVRLLSEDKINSSDLYLKGPSTVRGDENKKVLLNLYPDLEFTINENLPVFYKDLTWKSFGGRSKSEALKHDEEYFVSGRVDFKEEQLFPWLTSEDVFYEDLNTHAYQVKVKGIQFNNEKKFVVECVNGTEFTVEKLYFGRAPAYFLEKFINKSELSDKFIQFCESTNTVSALYIKYLFEKPISDMKETMFIPLSYTHEWGHYIGEFKTRDEKQVAEFFHYINKDHVTEEDMSRIIRSLKKSFEKIFDNFLKINFQEFISIEDEVGCLKIDDGLFEDCVLENLEMFNRLFFLGKSAPIPVLRDSNSRFEYSNSGVTHLGRAILNYRILCEKI